MRLFFRSLLVFFSFLTLSMAANNPQEPKVFFHSCAAEHGVLNTKEPSPLDRSALTHYSKKSGFSYSVAFLDVSNHTGLGFDDPTRGASRRAVATSVLDYLSSLIQNRAGVLEVQFELSLNDTTQNYVAVGGSPYLGVNGFVDSGSAIKLLQGQDITSDFADISVTVNFGLKINDTLNEPAFDEFDLYSILLHEYLHGLGATSLCANEQGQSSFSANNLKTFTRWDSFLTTANGDPLWDSAGNTLVSSSVFVGGSGGVIFHGPYTSQAFGSSPKIYTPAIYSNGSSMRHWDDSITEASLLPVTFTGATFRTLAPIGRGLLEDLGYKTSTKLLYTWISNRTGNFESTIILNNFGSEAANITFTARRTTGETETTAIISVPARGFLKEKAATLFPSLGSGDGYTVVAESSVDTVVGRFITNDTVNQSPSQGDAVALPTGGSSSSQIGTSVAFGFLPVTGGFISGPVVVNVGTEPANINFYIYNAAGQQIGVYPISTTVPLRPYVVLTTTMVPGLAEDVYIIATSTQPLTGVNFVFNSQKQTAIGNTTKVDFTP